MNIRTNRSVRALVGAVIAAALSNGASAYIYDMIAVMTPVQETPQTASNGFGCATVKVDTTANTLTYTIVHTNLSSPETAAHFHGMAGPRVNAGVLFALALGNHKQGVVNYVQAQEADILAGRMYINIHSQNFPAGEIRGQVVSHHIEIDNAQEVPPNASAARGWGVVSIDKVNKQLSYFIEHNVANETAAHFHAFANYGVNAGVLINLGTGSPKVGTVPYVAADERRWLDGQVYVNIHSTAFPGGEIRGQVAHAVAPLHSFQESPCNTQTSPAAGCALIAVDTTTDTLGFDQRIGGLLGPETACHIHAFADRCVNAGVNFAQVVGARKLGVWPYGAANELNALTNRAYFNVHSGVFPGGEIRGQLTLDCTRFGDTNGDNMVGFSDLNNCLSDFGGMGPNLGGDVNGDHSCGFPDLNIILSGFGVVCQ